MTKNIKMSYYIGISSEYVMGANSTTGNPKYILNENFTNTKGLYMQMSPLAKQLNEKCVYFEPYSEYKLEKIIHSLKNYQMQYVEFFTSYIEKQ